MEIVALKNVLNALLFSGVGLVVLAMSFYVFDRLTPGHLWKEIVEEQNLPLAIVAGAFTLSMAIIIASAIHG